MPRTLSFTLLDDGNVLVEFKNVASTNTMSMRAKDIRSCPFIDLFVGCAGQAQTMEQVVIAARQNNPRGFNDV